MAGVGNPHTAGVRRIVSRKIENSVCFPDESLPQKVPVRSQIVNRNKVPNASLQTWLMLYKCLPVYFGIG